MAVNFMSSANVSLAKIREDRKKQERVAVRHRLDLPLPLDYSGEGANVSYTGEHTEPGKPLLTGADLASARKRLISDSDWLKLEGTRTKRRQVDDGNILGNTLPSQGSAIIKGSQKQLDTLRNEQTTTPSPHAIIAIGVVTDNGNPALSLSDTREDPADPSLNLHTESTQSAAEQPLKGYEEPFRYSLKGLFSNLLDDDASRRSLCQQPDTGSSCDLEVKLAVEADEQRLRFGITRRSS